jgi:hypothetical protein
MAVCLGKMLSIRSKSDGINYKRGQQVVISGHFFSTETSGIKRAKAGFSILAMRIWCSYRARMQSFSLA